MNFIKITQDITFNIDSEVIYFFHKYVNWNYAKTLEKNNNMRKLSSRILDFKKGETRAFNYYRKALEDKISRITIENWIICGYPSHDSYITNHSNTDEFLSICNFSNNIKYIKNLISKKYEELPKHDPKYGDRSIERDLSSLKINYDVNGKNVIVIDDVTTSGFSLLAAKKILEKNGAKKILMIAMGKTADHMLY